MDEQSVRAELDREPFVPLRVYLQNGKRYDIPFREAAHLMAYGQLLIFFGVKEGSRVAKGYDRFPFDHITRIEQRPRKGWSWWRRKSA